MAQMYCSRKVKYNGTSFPPLTPFEVADKDVPDLIAAGAWLIEKSATPKEELAEDKPKKETKVRRTKSKEAK